ncbi:MAG TPA: TetR/AcrR family transcriptional regulator, partial [bacterium]|nr:TetR/AcrR family transcriptional regulator [bacterium]
ARTTISEVARIAGVRRMTVYNHFATDAELFDACSSHWFTCNPPPDASAWARISDPGERTRTALGEMYAYYRRGEAMLANVIRDAPSIPALAEILERKWVPAVEGMVSVLTDAPVPTPADDHLRLRAAVGLALDFFTWQSLTRAGLDDEGAAELAARLVAAVR